MTRQQFGFWLGAVSITWALTGCSTATKPEEAAPTVSSQVESLVAPHRDKAAQLEAQGNLRDALNEWKVALTINPKDPLSLEGKQKTEERIKAAVDEALTRGREALKRGIQLEAQRYFLRVLALEPSNKVAFDALQNEAKQIRVLSHTVRRGETLSSIAELYYRDRSRSEVIWETNQLPANPKLTPGMVLKIPEIPGVPFSGPAAPVPQPRSKTESPPPEAAKPEPPEPQEPEYNPMLAEAREALDRKEFTVALANVDHFLAQNPRSVEAADLKKTVLYQQGKILFDQRKYAESYAALNQLAKLAPGYQDSSSMLGRARGFVVQQHYNDGIRLYREEKLEPAIAEWRVVLQYDPNHEAAKKNIEQAERLLKGLQQRQQKK
jgi:tetratricopeptide (TPR) repeat protein